MRRTPTTELGRASVTDTLLRIQAPPPPFQCGASDRRWGPMGNPGEITGREAVHYTAHRQATRRY